MRTILTRRLLYRLPPPLDEITLANALVLKDPPLHLIDKANMPNFIRCMHNDLENQLGTRVVLPNLHPSQFVGIFSDYGGDEPGSDYFTYSFLIISLDSAGPCLKSIHEIRAEHNILSPRREMAFKNLSYGPLARALPQWLDAIDSVPGLLFTLMVDKRAKSIVTRNNNEALRALADDMQAKDRGRWRKGHVAERFMRIAHCVAYWCSILCRQDQQVIWLSDNDSIAEDSVVEALKQVTMSAAADYRRDLHVTFSFGRESQIPEQFREYREFISYPDLVAGSVGHSVTRAMPKGTAFGSHRLPWTPETKPKAVRILRWLAWQRIGLKKAMFLCRPEGLGLRGAFGSVDHDEIPDSVRFVPVTGDGTRRHSQPLSVQCRPDVAEITKK